MSAVDEQLHPELLKMVDDVFEFDLPLGQMTVNHNSEVMIIILEVNSIKKYSFTSCSSTKPYRSVFEIFILLESL